MAGWRRAVDACWLVGWVVPGIGEASDQVSCCVTSGGLVKEEKVKSLLSPRAVAALRSASLADTAVGSLEYIGKPP